MARVLVSLALAVFALGCSSTGATPVVPASPLAWGSAEWPASGADPHAALVLGFASAQIGKRYCWGGTGPDCVDCSGLVQAAWRTGGVSLPRTSDAQGRVLVAVPFDQVRPGDILWWRHHVGLYAGNGEMIDAYHSGAGVVRRRVAVPERVLRVLP